MKYSEKLKTAGLLGLGASTITCAALYGTAKSPEKKKEELKTPDNIPGIFLESEKPNEGIPAQNPIISALQEKNDRLEEEKDFLSDGFNEQQEKIERLEKENKELKESLDGALGLIEAYDSLNLKLAKENNKLDETVEFMDGVIANNDLLSRNDCTLRKTTDKGKTIYSKECSNVDGSGSGMWGNEQTNNGKFVKWEWEARTKKLA